MEGLLFLLDLAGKALAQAQAELAALRERVAELEAERDQPG